LGFFFVAKLCLIDGQRWLLVTVAKPSFHVRYRGASGHCVDTIKVSLVTDISEKPLASAAFISELG